MCLCKKNIHISNFLKLDSLDFVLESSFGQRVKPDPTHDVLMNVEAQRKKTVMN